MSTLKYAILGMLNQHDMSGYELTKQFEQALAEFWPARHSQIYPELRRLHEQGFVTYQVEISGTVLEKKVYTITEQGRQEFLEWLQTCHKMPATPKDESRLQIFFSGSLSRLQRKKLLEDQLEQHRLRLEHLQENQKKFPCQPAPGCEDFGDYMVLMGAVMREQSTCAWLEKCLELCEENEI